jgi:hypothetical protein
VDELVHAWPNAVGPAIADNAWPARVGRDGTLHVATRSSTWAFELTQLEAGIRKRLAEALGEAAPRRLRFAPGRLPERGREPEEAAPPSPAEPTEKHRNQAAAIASTIGDEELRSLVARAAAMSLASVGSGRSL